MNVNAWIILVWYLTREIEMKNSIKISKVWNWFLHLLYSADFHPAKRRKQAKGKESKKENANCVSKVRRFDLIKENIARFLFMLFSPIVVVVGKSRLAGDANRFLMRNPSMFFYDIFFCGWSCESLSICYYLRSWLCYFILLNYFTFCLIFACFWFHFVDSIALFVCVR